MISYNLSKISDIKIRSERINTHTSSYRIRNYHLFKWIPYSKKLNNFLLLVSGIQCKIRLLTILCLKAVFWFLSSISFAGRGLIFFPLLLRRVVVLSNTKAIQEEVGTILKLMDWDSPKQVASYLGLLLPSCVTFNCVAGLASP